MQVSLPADDLILCRRIAPSGYLKIELQNYPRCGQPNAIDGLYNGIRIHRPTDGIVTCSLSAPPGYVVTEALVYGKSLHPGKCGLVYGGNPPAPNAYRIEHPRDGMVICDRSGVPEGYVITELPPPGRPLEFGKCGPVYGGNPPAPNAYRIELPRDGIVICDRSSVPPAYAITEVREYDAPLRFGKCGPSPYREFRITHPKANTVVCLRTKAPPGFVVTERLVSAKCGKKPSYLRYNALRIAAASP